MAGSVGPKRSPSRRRRSPRAGRGHPRCRRPLRSRPTSRCARPSPKRLARSAMVPCPMSRPDAKMPIRSHTDLDLVEQVAREQDRHAPLPNERAEQVQHFDDAEGVDRGRRLVQDQDVGVLHQGVGDAEALEHAPRVRIGRCRRRRSPGRPARGPARSSHRRWPCRDPVQLGRVTQVLAAGQVGVEADAVRHVADPPLDLERSAGRVQADDAGPALRSARSGRAASGSSSSCRPRSGRAARRSRPPGPRGSGGRRRRGRRSSSSGRASGSGSTRSITGGRSRRRAGLGGGEPSTRPSLGAIRRGPDAHRRPYVRKT